MLIITVQPISKTMRHLARPTLLPLLLFFHNTRYISLHGSVIRGIHSCPIGVAHWLRLIANSTYNKINTINAAQLWVESKRREGRSKQLTPPDLHKQLKFKRENQNPKLKFKSKSRRKTFTQVWVRKSKHGWDREGKSDWALLLLVNTNLWY